MKPVRAVGFDLDGTFLHTYVDYPGLYSSDRIVLERHGIDFTEVFGENPPEKRLRAPIRQWLEAHGRGDEFEAIDAEIDDTCTHFEIKDLDRAVPYPRSLECLDVLKSKGLKVGLLSRGGYEYAEKALRKFGVFEKMDVVMGRDYSSYDDAKPSATAMLQFAEQLGVEPDEILYLGDNITDYMSSRDAGATFIGVLSGAADSEFWEKVSPGMFTLPFAGDVVDYIDDMI